MVVLGGAYKDKSVLEVVSWWFCHVVLVNLS